MHYSTNDYLIDIITDETNFVVVVVEIQVGFFAAKAIKITHN